MSDTENKTYTTAKNLTVALKNNTRALQAVRVRYRITLITLALVVFTLGLVINARHDDAVERCETSNRVRADNDAKFDSIATFLKEGGTADSPEGREFIELIEQDLVKEDCSDIEWLIL